MKYICIVLYSCIISYTILLLFLSFYKFVKITMNSFLIHKLKVEFLFYFIWLLHLLILQHFFEWSDSASVLVLGSSCYQFIPISSGARRASAVTKSQGCCLYSLFFRQTERCYQKPLVSVCEASICVSLHFCHRMCTKCWLTAFWVTAPPLFPREHFVVRLIYPLRHTGITFLAVSIYPEGDGGSYRCPIWTCRVTIPGIKGGNIKFWGERGKKAARLCVMEMLAWYLPIAISQCPQTPLQKAITALQLRVKGQNSLLCSFLWWWDAGIATMHN